MSGVATCESGASRAEREAAALQERRDAFEAVSTAAYELMQDREYGDRRGTVVGYRDGRPIGGYLGLVRTGDTLALTFDNPIANETHQLVVPVDDADGIAAESQGDVPIEALKDLAVLVPELK